MRQAQREGGHRLHAQRRRGVLVQDRGLRAEPVDLHGHAPRLEEQLRVGHVAAVKQVLEVEPGDPGHEQALGGSATLVSDCTPL